MIVFNFSMRWDWGEGLMDILVKGRRTTFFRGSFRGHPDQWVPSEGGELQDLEICYADGRQIDYNFERDATFIDEVQERIDEIEPGGLR